MDTVSRVVRLVNSYFRAPDLREDSTLRTYEKILFGDVPYAPEQLTYALKHRQEYRQDFQKAIAWRGENDNGISNKKVLFLRTMLISKLVGLG